MRTTMTRHCNFSARAVSGACILGLLLAGTAGCTRPVTSDGAWSEGVPRNQTFSRLLVVGVSPDINARCAFEEALVDSLRATGVTAKSSCTVLGTKVPLTREAVERGVADFGADAVVATRLVASSAGLEEGGTIETRGAGYYKATDIGFETGYWGVYGVPVVYGEFQTAPSVFSVQGEVRIATSVYATSGPTLVYVVQTNATHLESRDQALVQIGPAIATQLSRGGLIP